MGHVKKVLEEQANVTEVCALFPCMRPSTQGMCCLRASDEELATKSVQAAYAWPMRMAMCPLHFRQPICVLHSVGSEHGHSVPASWVLCAVALPRPCVCCLPGKCTGADLLLSFQAPCWPCACAQLVCFPVAPDLIPSNIHPGSLLAAARQA